MQIVTFLQKKIAYSIEGSGAPLVLLHGFCEDSSIWDDFIQDINNSLIIRIDLPGFGKSEFLPNASIEQMADGVKAVLDQENIERCVMIGHSMGGYVAIAFAEKYEDRLLGLGMFHSHPFEDSEEKKQNRRKSIDFISRYGHALYVKQLIPSLFANLFATSNEFLINRLIHNAMQFTSAAITQALEAMINRTDRSGVMTKLHIPILFIIGKQDETVPYDISLRQTHLPAVADIHILPRVAHMGMFRAKDETVKIVNDFVEFCTRRHQA